jgi:sigma-E factor negative regulatory protein RseA
MTQEISALMDGELDTAEVDGILKVCRNGEPHGEAWRCYHLIGDTLRQEYEYRPGLEERILGQLQGEPTVLAPRRRAWSVPLPRIAMAAAASLATVSAVTWLAFQQSPNPPKVITVTQAPIVQPVPVSNLEDYLLAHREFSAPPDALMPASFGPSIRNDSNR